MFSFEEEGTDNVKMYRPARGPSPFEVSLFSYNMQPWNNRNADLRQWFNFGLNPTTWTQYSLMQIKLFWLGQTVCQASQAQEVS